MEQYEKHSLSRASFLRSLLSNEVSNNSSIEISKMTMDKTEKEKLLNQKKTSYHANVRNMSVEF